MRPNIFHTFLHCCDHVGNTPTHTHSLTTHWWSLWCLTSSVHVSALPPVIIPPLLTSLFSFPSLPCLLFFILSFALCSWPTPRWFAIPSVARPLRTPGTHHSSPTQFSLTVNFGYESKRKRHPVRNGAQTPSRKTNFMEFLLQLSSWSWSWSLAILLNWRSMKNKVVFSISMNKTHLWAAKMTSTESKKKRTANLGDKDPCVWSVSQRIIIWSSTFKSWTFNKSSSRLYILRANEREVRSAWWLSVTVAFRCL